jgi:hypothetical protein
VVVKCGGSVVAAARLMLCYFAAVSLQQTWRKYKTDHRDDHDTGGKNDDKRRNKDYMNAKQTQTQQK